MAYQPQKLMLYKGLPSSASLGNTGTTDNTPETVNLRDGVFGLYDEKPFEPQIAGLKEAAVWVDAVSTDGRELLAGGDGNVIETIHLRASSSEDTLQARAAAIKALRRFMLAAQQFWTHRHNVDPVYLCWWATGAAFEQYALVHRIKIVSLVDGFNPNRIGLLTLQIEREPYWRPVAPGGNPKLFAFQQRGLVELVDYDHDDLDLMAFGAAADLQSAVEATIYGFDESTSASHTGRVNYVDIPASACAGDAPIPAMVTVDLSSGTPSTTELHISQFSGRDFFPDEATNTQKRRLGNTLNGADATIFSGDPDLTVTKATDATNGVFSSNSSVNRSVLNLAYNANAVSGMACYWNRAIAQFPGKYAVFLRCVVSSGTASLIGFRVGVNLELGTSGTPESEWVYLPSSTYGPLYLGEIDAANLGRRAASTDGDGVEDDGYFSLYLHTINSAGNAASINLIDLVLMPIDEGYSKVTLTIDQAINAGVSPTKLMIDGTGYYTGGPIEQVTSIRNAVVTPRIVEHSGAPILLRPGVRNRLYFMPKGGAPYPSLTYQVRVNVLPRWASVRDE
jgi:hypothetical protein